MVSFSQDKKWMEAKKLLNQKYSWIDIVSYYRSIGGNNVFVYCIGNGDKKLIVDIVDDDNVLLINKLGEPIIESYEDVLNSRKVFSYSENFENREFFVGSKRFVVALERK